MIKLSDYVANKMVEFGISHVFMVPGGLAMHLNDSFAKCEGLKCILNHHEQACAMAAEAYGRINDHMAAVCTTAGPAATNAITGVLGAFQDSIPMLVISGQSRLATMACESGLSLRSRGIQECNICKMIEPVTKYCELIKDPSKIRYCLEKALYLAVSGRPGPCWLDIPMDIQGKMIDESVLVGFDPANEGYEENKGVSEEILDTIIEKISEAERPVIFAGNGIRIGKSHKEFIEFVNRTGIPVVDGMSSVDAIASDHELYIGRGGTTGTRAGNLAIQNADLLISLGSRLNYNQTGFNTELWARGAYKIINDIDGNEVRKDSINADLEVVCDVKKLLTALNNRLTSKNTGDFSKWAAVCRDWKKKYPIVTEKQNNSEKANIYTFVQLLTERLPADVNIVVSVGQSRVIGSQAAEIKEGQRFIANATTASMGYGLPALIGACIANNKHKTVLITGEGSIQMNLQELQTIVHHQLPVVVFVINNGGYHTVKQTQKNYFNSNFIGIGPESGDISFPSMSKIADAYGITYYSAMKNNELNALIDETLGHDLPVIAEVFSDPEQITVPKASSKRLESGEMVSAPLEDMAPFLPREELEQNMFIPML